MVGAMPGDPDPVAVGTEGTVTRVSGRGRTVEQIDVAWDNGRRLMLLPEDPFIIVSKGGMN